MDATLDVNQVLGGIVSLVTIVVDNVSETWGKSLEFMPTVTMREIEKHCANTGKSGQPIAKTMERGKKFKNERYIDANNIFTLAGVDGF